MLLDKFEREIAFEFVTHVLVQDEEARQLLFLADQPVADRVLEQAAVDPADAHAFDLFLARLLAELHRIHLIVPDVLIRGVQQVAPLAVAVAMVRVDEPSLVVEDGLVHLGHYEAFESFIVQMAAV